MTVTDADLQELYELAKEARAGAYVPYSGFTVGCAIRLTNGKVVTGANIENASFPVSLCAERATLAAVFSQHHGENRSVAAVVVTGPDDAEDCAPCGACRQVIHELAPNAVVAFPHDGKLTTLTPDELLPFGFRLEDD